MIDARLLVPAGSAWLGAAIATGVLALPSTVVERHTAGRVGLLAGAAGMAVVAVAMPLARRRLAPFGSTLGMALVFLLLGSSAAALGIVVASSPPLGAWIDAGATAVIRGSVAGEPQVRRVSSAPVWQSATRIDVRLDAERISARGQSLELAVPILLRLGPGAQVPAPGTTIELTGRLRPVPPRLGVAASLTVGPREASGIVVVGDPGPVDRVAQAMRVGLRQSLAGVDAAAGSLVAGLSVGDESGQPTELAVDMRDSGLSHLTAVSGGNVAIVLGFVFAVTTLARFPLMGRALVGIGGLGFFVVLVGPQPSVLRAAAMGAIAVGGVLTGGRRAGPSILGAGILLLVIVAPWLAVSWAFALSAFATAGLILLAPGVADRLATWPLSRRWPLAIREAVALTSAAQLATLPILVAMGGAVGWVALPANLLAMPAVAPVTILGLLAAALAPVAPPLATLIATGAAWPAGWIATVAGWSAGLPLAHLPWPAGWLGVGGLALLVVAVGAGASVGRRLLPEGPSGAARTVAGVVLATMLVTLIAMPPDRRGWPPPGWFMIMCDVGQGDAFLVRTGPGAALVIDVGPDPEAVDDCLDAADVAAVPAVILTHFHADHVRGLAGVLRGRSVGVVLTSPVLEPEGEAALVAEVLSAAGLRAQAITAGDSRSVGGVEWQVLWPRRRITAGSVPNNASLVLAVTVDGRRILLSGDIEPEAQVAVAADLRLFDFDVVKVPHHGSRYQSALLTTSAPAPVALISVGADNDYGHPAPETVAAWTEMGALVARTDRDGEVAVVSSADGLGVVARTGRLPG